METCLAVRSFEKAAREGSPSAPRTRDASGKSSNGVLKQGHRHGTTTFDDETLCWTRTVQILFPTSAYCRLARNAPPRARGSSDVPCQQYPEARGLQVSALEATYKPKRLSEPNIESSVRPLTSAQTRPTARLTWQPRNYYLRRHGRCN